MPATRSIRRAHINAGTCSSCSSWHTALADLLLPCITSVVTKLVAGRTAHGRRMGRTAHGRRQRVRFQVWRENTTATAATRRRPCQAPATPGRRHGGCNWTKQRVLHAAKGTCCVHHPAGAGRQRRHPADRGLPVQQRTRRAASTHKAGDHGGPVRSVVPLGAVDHTFLHRGHRAHHARLRTAAGARTSCGVGLKRLLTHTLTHTPPLDCVRGGHATRAAPQAGVAVGPLPQLQAGGPRRGAARPEARRGRLAALTPTE